MKNENNYLSAKVLELSKQAPMEARPLKPLTEYAQFTQTRSWEQRWCPEKRALQEAAIPMQGTVWSDAIERSMEEQNGVLIPAMDEPLWLDRPILVASGSQIIADPQTEIRMIGGEIEYCLVRNKSLVSGQSEAVELCKGADRDILIQGGIWSDQKNNGHGPQGFRKGKEGLMLGSQGCMVLSNVENLTVRDVTIRDNSSFGFQIGNARNFIVEGVRVDGTKDGVHIEGPSECGIIRDVKGPLAGDDVVALNAWDWRTSSVTFGSITDMWVEDTDVDSGACAIRILPGVKKFPNGQTQACDIARCYFKDIRSCYSFKMYDQPNVRCVTEDYSEDLGTISDVCFDGVYVPPIDLSTYYDDSKNAVFELCEHAEGLHFRNIHLDYTPGKPFPEYLLSIGPKSLIRPKFGDREKTNDIFNPTARPVAKDITLEDIFIHDTAGAGALKVEDVEGLISRNSCQ